MVQTICANIYLQILALVEKVESMTIYYA